MSLGRCFVEGLATLLHHSFVSPKLPTIKPDFNIMVLYPRKDDYNHR